MEKYDRGEIVEDDVPIPFPEDIIGKDYAKIEVKPGSRIFNLVNFAQTSLKKDVSLVISASGPAITKAVTITEIIKRKQDKVYQWNKIGFKEIKEFWDPNEVGMTRLRVTRELPTMHIFLSMKPLDETLPGVQVPDKKEKKARRQSEKESKKPISVASKAKNIQEKKRSRKKSGTKSTISEITTERGEVEME